MKARIVSYEARPIPTIPGWWMVWELSEGGGERSLGSLVYEEEADARKAARDLVAQIEPVREALVESHDRAIAGVGGGRRR